jgi:hypothetical protein
VVDQDLPVAEGALSRRLHALEIFAAQMTSAVRLGPLTWHEANPDLRALAINNGVRRQRDALDGTIALGKAGQGHLAVAFVRAFLEERIWVSFLAAMPGSEASALLGAMGRWDAVRSVVAQRDYVGDRVMSLDLWYPPGFVDAQAATLPALNAELRRLRDGWGWQGILPPVAWVADQVSLRDEYDYLHSATSRALHFSAGEVLRRGWGTPGGVLITAKEEFRAHLADFAYDELWRLHLATILGAADLLGEAAISVTDDFFSDEGQDRLTSELMALGRVPVVHAYEWNLTPPPLRTRLAWAAVVLGRSADAAPDDLE